MAGGSTQGAAGSEPDEGDVGPDVEGATPERPARADAMELFLLLNPHDFDSAEEMIEAMRRQVRLAEEEREGR